jgi:hypothetical protein
MAMRPSWSLENARTLRHAMGAMQLRVPSGDFSGPGTRIGSVVIATRAAGLAVFALLAVVGVAACGQRTAASSTGRLEEDLVHGIAVQLPPGWQRAKVSLTPALSDPREVLSVATFPLHYRQTGCAHFPSSALEDLGPGDALITLEERGLDPHSTWPDFPLRPAHFTAGLGGRSEASACAPSARFTDHWFGFTDGGRHFHVLVAFGPDPSAGVQRQAWEVLDSLKVDPRVRPDWQSSG